VSAIFNSKLLAWFST